MKKIILASNNAGKIAEVKQILRDMDMMLLSMREAGVDIEIEENGETFEENALIKARAVMQITGEVTIADDSGLEVDYLGKAPGVYSARYMGHDTAYEIKNQSIIDRLSGVTGADRSARFVCAIAAVFPDGRELVTRAAMEGRIADKPMGGNGFGYDPIVWLPELEKTAAQLSPDEKNRISHRGKALDKMKEELIKYL